MDGSDQELEMIGREGKWRGDRTPCIWRDGGGMQRNDGEARLQTWTELGWQAGSRKVCT